MEPAFLLVVESLSGLAKVQRHFVDLGTQMNRADILFPNVEMSTCP